MSADFWSWAIPIAPRDGDTVVRSLRKYEVVESFVGPNGQLLHRFDRDGEWVDPGAAKQAYASASRAKPPERLGSAHLAAPFEELENLLTGGGEPAQSPNWASLVVLDRAVALPNGVSLLRGRALRLISSDDVAALGAALASLESKLGRTHIVGTIESYLERHGNGREDAESVLTTLDAGIVAARETHRGLLLFGCIVP